MDKDTTFQNTGHVGRRGAIVLPAASRRRYGLADGSLFISEEREDGILIRPAKAVPSALDDVRRKIQVGLDQLERGEGLDGEEALAQMKQMSAAFQAKKKK
jgi:AbrB family looped-hinge helix DNA binding protein